MTETRASLSRARLREKRALGIPIRARHCLLVLTYCMRSYRNRRARHDRARAREERA